MLSSTTRADTVGITRPTDPIFRIASSPISMQVTGDISVCPNAARILASGNVSDIVRSSTSLAGAAPQESVFSLILRGFACWAAQTACHWAGTRKIPVTPSDSRTSSSAPGSKAPNG
ncbi:Uncharacterised protein [Mycobacteroides abscessus subsp. massiliense]|nr:Uncharacterised protein [Mycobacteroides abscessus subsp. massiliense]